MKTMKKKLSMLLCMMLVVAMTVVTNGCGSSTDESAVGTDTNVAVETEAIVIGEGATQFMFTVVDQDGNETAFEIHTDKATVGEALLEHEMIAGEEGDFGIYVKTVNGITADYDVDGTYWAFYINGEYATTGVDVTEIAAGNSYSFKEEK